MQTALGKEELLLGEFAGNEGVSQLFSFTLDLLSENAAVDPASVLRKPATVTIELPGGGQRYINGTVNRFLQLGQLEGLTFYRAEIVPWLWFLSLSSDCKIFQNLSVTEI
ncbi:MAG: contractile injection system protein, VgrG/Pvc8 family, partial [Gemmatimonadota bacterium]|nr:contractile injection system protein, VgrG/Pvc8 family [Gemmatimonadota bacterium]